ncbi:MAG: aminotransferase, class [Glaciihabitans sp.]|nr:aminotransferase, class [Glaciihabitans sp.]
MREPGDLRSLFPAAAEGVYLNSAAEGLYLGSHIDAMQGYAALKAQGSNGRAALAAIEEEARGLTASLLGVAGRDIAFLASTSRGMDVALRSIDWQPGDNVVFGDGEFPTVAFAGALLATRGVEQRVIAVKGGALSEADIVAAIDERTRLVVVSLVSYKHGQRLDVHWITERAHERGALVFVDAVQALGTIEVSARGLDFLSAGTFKWILGSHGVSIFYASPTLPATLLPPYVGYRGVSELFPVGGASAYALWPDARRFEEGMPNHLGICVLANALRFLLEVGVAEIEKHNLDLVARTREGLGRLGIPILGGAPKATGSIVAFETERFAEIEGRLARHGTTVWAREGRVRIAPHIYNTPQDIDTVLDQLGEFAS